MKIVILCGGEPNQIALASKVAERFSLAGIVLEKRPAKKANNMSLKTIMNKIFDRTLFISIRKSWFNMLDYYSKKYEQPKTTESITVSNINSEETIQFLERTRPDLIMVSGTGLIKKGILSLPVKYGIVNLHTGLSPYIKGGPNCTNWCIANNELHLIGNTVMWIDAGIDSGDLIATEITSFEGSENLNEIHVKVMEHAHDLYLRSVKGIEKNYPKVSRVKQNNIAQGKTFYTKEWKFREKKRLLRNLKDFRKNIQSEKYKELKSKVVTVSVFQN